MTQSSTSSKPKGLSRDLGFYDRYTSEPDVPVKANEEERIFGGIPADMRATETMPDEVANSINPEIAELMREYQTEVWIPKDEKLPGGILVAPSGIAHAIATDILERNGNEEGHVIMGDGRPEGWLRQADPEVLRISSVVLNTLIFALQQKKRVTEDGRTLSKISLDPAEINGLSRACISQETNGLEQTGVVQEFAKKFPRFLRVMNNVRNGLNLESIEAQEIAKELKQTYANVLKVRSAVENADTNGFPRLKAVITVCQGVACSVRTLIELEKLTGYEKTDGSYIKSLPIR
jgi:hypothetical protein